ncbi:MAG: DUF1554 domain-containing protein [Myxococcales bacterium]|nr:DUF1554 domain-containing protein [Myxococcales bacterium]
MDCLRPAVPVLSTLAALLLGGGCIFNPPELETTGGSSSSGPATDATGPGETSNDATTAGVTTNGATSADESTGSASCGNGVVDPGEDCDDGNDDDTDDCVAGCVAASCGDGFVWAGSEDCDDAGESASCDDDCTAASCGDGTQNAAAGEQCDDGNTDDTDACVQGCVFASCGDGFVFGGVEDCDDANTDDTDDCVQGCVSASCGDGFVWAGMEVCDDGDMIDNNGCNNDCDLPFRYIFVSSQLYTGNLGGLAGADAECQTLATNAGLPGVYMAWLSTAAASPASRMTQSATPYRRPDGIQVAPNWAGLTDGTLDAPINVTETLGSPPMGNTSCGGGGFLTVWTAVQPDGTSSGSACTDWSSDVGGGQWGRADQTNTFWTSWCSGGQCSWLSPIYCVQQ